MKPLVGHDSKDTAYIVDDYPYGARQRCRIRYWLERNGPKGYRFVSQTEHPTKKIWNAQKNSTYQKLAGAMYLDEQQHVHWTGLSEYSSAKEVMDFIEKFPASCTVELADWCKQKFHAYGKLLDGTLKFTINGAAQPMSDARKEELKDEVAIWRNNAEQIGKIIMG